MDLRKMLQQPLLDDRFPLPLDSPFTVAQARAQGITPRHLHDLCSHGLLRRPIQGVYLPAQAGDSIAIRCKCLALVTPADCVICDRHAGWIHGADMVLAPNDHLELPRISVFRPSGNGRLRNDLSVSGERNLTPDDVCEVHGLAVTTELRTTLDLGRLLTRDQAFAALDAMLRLARFDKEELLANVERFRGMRGVRQLRSLAPLSDPRAESPGESALRLRWLDTGLPTPEPQVPVFRDGIVVARLDLGTEKSRFAAEYDGAEWHSRPEDREHDRVRRAWLEEQERWTIRAVRAHNVFGRHRDVELILHEGHRAALARARRVVIV